MGGVEPATKIRRLDAFRNLQGGLLQKGSLQGGIQVQEKRLPVFEKSDEILRCIDDHDVCILTGDTGSGKTSGVPHILAARAALRGVTIPKIVVTQPRRVAAIAIAKRVADEICKDKVIARALMGAKTNHSVGGLVGYRVRFDDRTSKQTRIAFVTDGLLIRECLLNSKGHSASFIGDSLDGYDYVIIDEVHERSLKIDELMGICRVGLIRRRFKLIIMSATLDGPTIKAFFQADPHITTGLVHVTGRMFPVNLFFTQMPCQDILEGCAASVSKLMVEPGHGDILVFLPGSEEIQCVERILRQQLETLKEIQRSAALIGKVLVGVKSNDEILHALVDVPEPQFTNSLKDIFGITEEIIPLADQRMFQKYLDTNKSLLKRSCIVEVGCTDNENIFVAAAATTLPKSDSKISQMPEQAWIDTEWEILPLFSSMSPEDQQRVFTKPRSDCHRKIILSTNIAETSLTLPNVRYVVDSGKVKLKYGSLLKTVDISKDMAKQRSGRAGRVAPGICYRLMTKAAYDSLEATAPPEISRCEIAELLLDLKCMDSDSGLLARALGRPAGQIFQMRDFPLPTQPSNEAVSSATKLLARLATTEGTGGKLTLKGYKLCKLPLPVMWGNLLLQSVEDECTAEILTIIAMLSLDVVWFTPPSSTTDLRRDDQSIRTSNVRKRFLNVESDHIGYLNLYNGWKAASNKQSFCRLLGMGTKNFERAHQVRQQLQSTLVSCEDFGVDTVKSLVAIHTASNLDEVHRAIRKCIMKGLFLNVASRRNTEETEKGAAAIYVGEASDERLMIHPTSSFFVFGTKRPEYIVYSSVVETTHKFARDVSTVDPDWIIDLRRVA